MRNNSIYVLLAVLSVMAVPRVGFAEVLVPARTTVPLVIEENVTSKKRAFVVGQLVRASVAEDVIVDREVVLLKGTPAVVRVSESRKARMAGTKGRLSLEAISTTTVDGRNLALAGALGQRGKGTTGVAVAAAVIVAAPLIFIKGKAARIAAGTVMESATSAALTVAGVPYQDLMSQVPADRVSTETDTLVSSSGVEVQVGAREGTFVHVRFQSCSDPLDQPIRALTINAREIDRADAAIGVLSRVEEAGCVTVKGQFNTMFFGEVDRDRDNVVEFDTGTTKLVFYVPAEQGPTGSDVAATSGDREVLPGS